MTPPPTQPPKPRNQKWTPERDALLRKLYPEMVNTDIAERMGITAKVVAHRASAIQLYKTRAYKQAMAQKHSRARSPWTEETEELLQLLYPHAMPGQMEELLGMDRDAVRSKAYDLGINKTEALRSQIATARQAQLRSRIGEAAYRQQRWQDGHLPWNTGTKGQHTGFAKGNVPPTMQPVGTVRVRKISGVPNVLMEKVAHPDKRRQVAHLVWEIANGRPLPHNHVLAFRDGCRHNLNPENLQLLTRKQWALRISPLCNPDLPPDHAIVLRLRGALTRSINSAQKRIDRAAQNTGQSPPANPPQENPKP